METAVAKKANSNGHNPPVIDLYRSGPASQIAKMLRSSEITKQSVFSVLERIGPSNGFHNSADYHAKMDTPNVHPTSLIDLHDTFKDAQVLSFKVRKRRKDLHLMDVSRRVDAAIKGNAVDSKGNPLERARVATGIAFVYTEKPNTAIIFTEFEVGSAHDARSILQESANGNGPAVSLFRKILPITYVRRNVKLEGALLQGWGCATFMDGNIGGTTTELKIAPIAADISTFIIPNTTVDSKKHRLWAMDITENVENILKNSDKKYKHLYVGTPHTTVFMATEKFELIDFIRNTEEVIAPRDRNYKHNRTAKDVNGRAHLASAFGGNYNMYQLDENGKLDLGAHNRIWLVECDPMKMEDGTIKTREREIIVALF
jgi:thiamine phosphate synthase YjbQ (UPF0047 family)